MNHLGVPGALLMISAASGTVDYGSGLDSEAKAGKDAEDLKRDSNLTCHLHLLKQNKTKKQVKKT